MNHIEILLPLVDGKGDCLMKRRPHIRWWNSKGHVRSANSSPCLSVFTILSPLASLTYTSDFHREKAVFDSSGGAESIIVNGPVSNFTQRVCKASTLYMQSRGALLKELVASDYFCNLISLVTQ